MFFECCCWCCLKLFLVLLSVIVWTWVSPSPANKMWDILILCCPLYRVGNLAQPHQTRRRASLRVSSMLKMQPNMKTWRPCSRVVCRAETVGRPRFQGFVHAPEPAASKVSLWLLQPLSSFQTIIIVVVVYLVPSTFRCASLFYCCNSTRTHRSILRYVSSRTLGMALSVSLLTALGQTVIYGACDGLNWHFYPNS